MDMIEAALRAENEEVLAAAKQQQRSPTRTRHSASSASGKRARNSSPWNSPRSPTRALLDTEAEAPRRASSAYTNGHISTTGYSTSYINHSPNLMHAQLVPAGIALSPTIDTSMITPVKITKSAATSPVDGVHRSAMSNAGRLRTSSDASNHPSSFGVRSGVSNGSDLSPQSSAGTLNSVALQKKSAPGSSWSKMMKPSAMAEVVRGGDLMAFGTAERQRNHSTGGLGKRFKSRSPAGWVRSNSPGVRGPKVKGGSPIAPKQTSMKKTVSNTSSPLSTRPRADSESSVDMEPKARTRRDSIVSKDGSEAITDDSSGNEDAESSDEEQYRGRRLSAIVYESEEFHQLQAASIPRDMMEATGQERDNFNTAKEMILEKRARRRAEKYGRKLPPKFERRPARPFKVQTSQPFTTFGVPSMTITSPVEKTKSNKPKCRPTTSFDKPYLSEKPPPVVGERKSFLSTPGSRPAGRKEVSEAQFNNPDAQANIIDIGNAQKLPIQRTPISDPHPSRTIRQIVRGNFNGIQKEARDPTTAHPRRLRKYLVATDLSSEATHALEWCVGTVLRDGDTLLAVYCVDEETGITSAEETHDDATPGKDWTDLNGVIVPVPGKAADNYFPRQIANTSAKLEGIRSTATSPTGHPRRHLPKPVEDRHHAVQQITERVEKLLRKTILQVKVVVEVIHCKSPKHLITEIIDLVSPTLVVLGSRGRGALKGVLLGSFSNYLVTKSSVPVMVARKKLHGKKKFKRRDVQHANNLGGEAVKVMIAATDQEQED